ncbi:MAG: hypothetical protein U5K29_00430 [Acidimicrobiales bacterium]|nr:hypothetical protein [Acidimicrobiales bacterium]
MSLILLITNLVLAALRASAIRLPFDDRGEGVISAAIAVLVMAFLGAAMWVGFNAIWADAETNIGDQVDTIGR